MTSLYPAPTDQWNLEMGSRLRQRVIHLFAWDQAGQMIINTYQELIERRKGHATQKGHEERASQPAQGTDQLVERRLR